MVYRNPGCKSPGKCNVCYGDYFSPDLNSFHYSIKAGSSGVYGFIRLRYKRYILVYDICTYVKYKNRDKLLYLLYANIQNCKTNISLKFLANKQSKLSFLRHSDFEIEFGLNLSR